MSGEGVLVVSGRASLRGEEPWAGRTVLCGLVVCLCCRRAVPDVSRYYSYGCDALQRF